MIDPLFAAYLSLTFALVITPGATTAVVVRNALAAGWRGGVWAGAGAAVGNTTHATIAGLGVGVVIARSPAMYSAIQLAGGCYLLWLGLRSAARAIGHHPLPASDVILASEQPGQLHHAWREGVSVNLLNPAIVTFYLAVVPSFVPSPAPRGAYLRLAATHVLMAFLVHVLWAISLDRLRHMLGRPAARRGLEALTAVALLLLAGRVLATTVRG